MTHIIHNQCPSAASIWHNITGLAAISLNASFSKSLACFLNQKEDLSFLNERTGLSSIFPILEQENKCFTPEQIDYLKNPPSKPELLCYQKDKQKRAASK